MSAAPRSLTPNPAIIGGKQARNALPDRYQG